MFERFLAVYGQGGREAPAAFWHEPTLEATPGYTELASKVSGVVLGNGLFQFHSGLNGPLGQRLVSEFFPEYGSRAVPFAHDWLGRQFAVDRARGTQSGPQLLLLEPGSGEVFEIDEDFVSFFDVGLVDEPDTYLESNLFQEWRSAGGGIPDFGQCVGFKLPLFLGGEGAVENLEITDLELYWQMSAQLHAAIKDIPPGTQIGGVGW